jgi:hypothetical protein
MVLALALAAAVSLHAEEIDVTSAEDAGPGSFRAAIEVASRRAGVDAVRFAPGLSVVLDAPVVYTGAQPLLLEGRGASVAGRAGATPAPTWGAGLFVSRGGADLEIRALAFRDSFDNGVAVLVPSTATGVVRVALHEVVIEGSRFHGLFVDDQATDAFDTDDAPHPRCVDPHFSQSAAGVTLSVERSRIARNGTLAGGFDTGTPLAPGAQALCGCPADFDGIRVDEAGAGDIRATIRDSVIGDNRADGVEYDERDGGGVFAETRDTALVGNGDTHTADLDDGFDIDEAGAGDVVARFENVTLLDNRDEGIDLDERGAGSISVEIASVVVAARRDEGVKVDESGEGDLDVRITVSRVSGSGAAGVELAQEAPGEGRLSVLACELEGNADGAFGAMEGIGGIERR